MKLYTLSAVLFSLLFFAGCRQTQHSAATLFEAVPVDHSKVDFKADLLHNADDIAGFLTGAGVSAGDINNDGLPDLLFAGGKQPARLFLNKGGLQFEDITAKAGVADDTAKGRTESTVLVDIDGDGWLDIYLVKYGLQGNPEGTYFSDYGSNLLFINQKDGTFKEQGREYGLNIVGFTTAVNFFDYDKDGDLDVIVLNNPDPGNSFDFNYFSTPPRLSVFNNRFLENTGNHFEDVTEKAGIALQRCIGQSVSIADVNNDGWLDIYIADDFFGKDYLYINNGNKTFTDRQAELLPKTTISSMGSDFADINGDGYLDLFTGEMLPEDAVRRKMNVVPFSNEIYSYMVAHKIAQYPRNMLQLNHAGNNFKDIGCLAGVEATEWTWACLFGDYDNDGAEDLFIANGIKRDITNMDFVKTNYGNNYALMADPSYKIRQHEKYEQLPSVPTPNYVYKNNGDLTFSKKTDEWGLNEPVHSRGAAYADLDNDGDLDLVINNIDTVASVYENHENEILKKNYLKIKLQGEGQNTSGFGSRAYVYANGKCQMKQLSCVRGFASSCEPLFHFGLDTTAMVDSIKIVWLNGKQEVKTKVKANQLITFSEKEGHAVNESAGHLSKEPWFKDVSTTWAGKPVIHADSNYNEFKSFRPFHRQFSKELPAAATADINNDGRDDLVMYNSWNDKSATALIQQANGSFREEKESKLDFGRFSNHITCMAPIDLDNDGDLDWFLNDRIDYANYPKPAGNYLLRNNHGTLEDVTDSIAPGLRQCGMITAATWADYNNDKTPDLIVAGEWMPITIFENKNGRLSRVAKDNGLQQAFGWWNSITAADFDKDGDLDFVAGNLGLNSVFRASEKEPITIYAADFDLNGTNDPIVFHYISGKNVPFVNRDLFCEQMPSYNNKFYTFENFAKAGFEDILRPEQQQASYKLKANYMASSYIENLGNGKFTIHALPNEAQVAPVYGAQPFDVNADGNLDLIVAGNSFSNHYEYGNYDALGALVLLGDGKGHFKAAPSSTTGLEVEGDAKNVLKISNKVSGTTMFFVPLNNDTMRVFKLTDKEVKAL